jgi:hypothetical protein
MVFISGGHRKPRPHSEDVGSMRCSTASPYSATRPPSVLLRTAPPHAWSLFPLTRRMLSLPAPLRTSLHVLLPRPTTRPHVRCSPGCPWVALIGSLSLSLSPMLHFLTSLLWRPHPPFPDPDLPHRFGRALPCWTCSPLCPWISRARLTHRPDDGGSTDLRNAGKLIPVYTALQPRRQPSSY